MMAYLILALASLFALAALVTINRWWLATIMAMTSFVCVATIALAVM